MATDALSKVKIIDKYAFSMIVTAIVIEGVVIYFEGAVLTVDFLSLLLHVFVLANFVCGILVLMRFKKGLALFRFLTPIIFYRFYQRVERESLREIANSEEVISYFVR